MADLLPFWVDLEAHEARRVGHCTAAGWTPDIDGEIQATEMLHANPNANLDREQLLAEMATWNVDR